MVHILNSVIVTIKKINKMDTMAEIFVEPKYSVFKVQYNFKNFLKFLRISSASTL